MTLANWDGAASTNQRFFFFGCSTRCFALHQNLQQGFNTNNRTQDWNRTFQKIEEGLGRKRCWGGGKARLGKVFFLV